MTFLKNDKVVKKSLDLSQYFGIFSKFLWPHQAIYPKKPKMIRVTSFNTKVGQINAI